MIATNLVFTKYMILRNLLEQKLIHYSGRILIVKLYVPVLMFAYWILQRFSQNIIEWW